MPLMLKLPRRPGSLNGLDTSAPQPSESLEEPGHPVETQGCLSRQPFPLFKGFAMVQIAKPSFFERTVNDA